MTSQNILGLENLNPVFAKILMQQSSTTSVVGPKAKIPACHVGDKGSIPLQRTKKEIEVKCIPGEI